MSAGGSASNISADKEDVVQHPNTEGTYHQSKLGSKPKRKHFLGGFDYAYSDAVDRDAATVEYTEDEEVGFFNVILDFCLTDFCVY